MKIIVFILTLGRLLLRVDIALVVIVTRNMHYVMSINSLW